MPTTVPATIVLETRGAIEVVDITERVAALVDAAPGVACHLYLRHTTAAVMIATAELGVPEAHLDVLQRLTPKREYGHDSPAHVAAHFLSALVGPSLHVPVRDGKLGLGQFQRILLMEFEGPRRREIEARMLAEA